MICPKCAGPTRVTDGFRVEKDNEHYRERKCTSCGHKFWTVEYEVEFNDSIRLKRGLNHRSYVRYL